MRNLTIKKHAKLSKCDTKQSQNKPNYPHVTKKHKKSGTKDHKKMQNVSKGAKNIRKKTQNDPDVAKNNHKVTHD